MHIIGTANSTNTTDTIDDAADMSNISLDTSNATIFEGGSASNRQYTYPYTWSFFAAFTAVSFALTLIDEMCIVAMGRSKRTPYAVKYMSIGLLATDCLYMVLSMCYQIPLGRVGKMIVLELLTVFSYQSYVTVSMMSLERMLLFMKPYVYLQHVTSRFLRRMTMCVWMAFTVVYLLLRFGGCYCISGSIDIDPCLDILGYFLCVIVVVVVVIFIVSYTMIVRVLCVQTGCIRSETETKHRHIRSKNRLGDFKVTSAILTYAMLTVLVSVALCVLGAHAKLMDTADILVVGHTITLVSCICNPIIYVLWFKECRDEMRKLVSCFHYSTWKTRFVPREHIRTHVVAAPTLITRLSIDQHVNHIEI